MVLMSERYAKNAGAVFSLKYHVVWCPKYRRPVLIDPVDARLKTLLHRKSTELGLIVHLMEVLPDHVHLFVEGGPTICVAEIVNRLKGFTSHELREEFPFLKSRLPTLWSRSYYAGSVGSVSEGVVRKYIEGQKGK
jgi:putative transposase